MTSITQAITTALLQFVWQGAVVAVILGAVLLFLARRSAVLRYGVCCIAMLVMLALPALTAYRAYNNPQSLSVETPSLLLPAPLILSMADAKPLQANWLAFLQSYALPVWLLGVLAFSIRLIWCGRQIAGLRRSAEAASESLSQTVRQLAVRLRSSRTVQVLISGVVDGPSVIGWIRPIILVPASSLTGLSPEQLEAVLAHEVAHIRRYDDLVNMVQALVETLLFYHPAIWWTSARIRRERELCCDDLAVRVTGDNLGYARALARLERVRLSSTTAMALGAADESLSYRIRRIVGEVGPESSRAKMPGIVALCICLGLAAVAINVSRMHSQTQQPAPAAGKVVLTPDGPAGFLFFQNRDGRISFVNDAPGVTVDPGGITVVNRTSVEYPQAARARGIEGIVTLEVTLDSNGNVVDARVLAGPVELRRISLQSVLQWRFGADAANSTRQIAIRFDSKVASQPQPWTDSAVVEARRKAEEKERASTEKAATLMTPDGPLTLRINPSPEQEQLAEMTRALEVQRTHLAELRREEELLAQAYKPEHPERMAVEREIEALEQALSNQSSMFVRSKIDQEQLQAQLQELQRLSESESGGSAARTAALQKQLEELQVKLRRAGGQAVVAGRTLTQIVFNGVPESSQSAIASRLPVRVGDSLTADSISALIAAIRSVDEHLAVTFELSGGNEAALKIFGRQ